MNCDFDGKHLESEDSLISHTHLTRGCAPHCVITEKEKDKVWATSKKDGWFTFFICLSCFLSLQSLLQRVSLGNRSLFPVSDCAGFIVFDKITGSTYGVRFSQRREDVLKVLGVCWKFKSLWLFLCFINKQNVSGKDVKNQKQVTFSLSAWKHLVCFIMRGTSFKLLWNLKLVKQSQRQKSLLSLPLIAKTSIISICKLFLVCGPLDDRFYQKENVDFATVHVDFLIHMDCTRLLL